MGSPSYYPSPPQHTLTPTPTPTPSPQSLLDSQHEIGYLLPFGSHALVQSLHSVVETTSHPRPTALQNPRPPEPHLARPVHGEIQRNTCARAGVLGVGDRGTTRCDRQVKRAPPKYREESNEYCIGIWESRNGEKGAKNLFRLTRGTKNKGFGPGPLGREQLRGGWARRGRAFCPVELVGTAKTGWDTTSHSNSPLPHAPTQQGLGGGLLHVQKNRRQRLLLRATTRLPPVRDLLRYVSNPLMISRLDECSQAPSLWL